MGKITVRTKEILGQSVYESEIIYEDSADFFFLENEKAERMNVAVKGFVDGLYGGEVQEPSAVVDMGVKKKDTKH